MKRHIDVCYLNEKRSVVTVSGLQEDLLREDAPRRHCRIMAALSPSLHPPARGKAPESPGSDHGEAAGMGRGVPAAGGRQDRGRVRSGRLIYGGCAGLDSLLAMHLRQDYRGSPS